MVDYDEKKDKECYEMAQAFMLVRLKYSHEPSRTQHPNQYFTLES